MSNQVPPGDDFEIGTFLQESGGRHEELVNVFGRTLMWMRKRAIDGTRTLVDSEETRQTLAAIFRQPYEEAATMSPEAKETAMSLAEAAVDAFVQLFLRVLAHQGTDFPIGGNHAARYVLDLEVLDRISEEVILRETINRNGQKHFANYWGQWLNRFGKSS